MCASLCTGGRSVSFLHVAHLFSSQVCLHVFTHQQLSSYILSISASESIHHCKLTNAIFSTHQNLFLTDDFRIFCGDLGNDVTDELLTRYFSHFASFVKAKVVRDKRTNKSKGYGFISFSDPQDYIRAMKEMNGEC